MKKCILGAVVCTLFILLFSSCGKKNKEMIDFYLSQPRDEQLFGMWMRPEGNQDENGRYTRSGEYYSRDGTVESVHYERDLDGKENIYYSFMQYYYTKEGKIYTYRPSYGIKYGSQELVQGYKISGDTLYLYFTPTEPGSIYLRDKIGCKLRQ